MKRPNRLLTLILIIVITATVIHAGTTTHTYYFDQPRVEIIGGQTVVILDGARTWAKVGYPLLPQAAVQLLLPPGEEAVSISVETASPLLLGDGYRINHMEQPFPLSVGPSGEPTQPNEAVYSSNNPFPNELSDNLQTQFLSGHGLAIATIHPVSYKPASGELSYYPWIKVSVTSQPTAKAQSVHAQMLKRSNDVQLRVAGMVDNPESVVTYGPEMPTDPTTYDMLLITSEDFVDLYQEYIDYKNRSGVKTVVETVQDIYNSYTGIDSQDKIRNCIIDYYTTYEVAYVFLCGDNEHIPTRMLWCVDDNLPSDLYYAGLDGTWNDDNDELWGEPGEDDLVAEVYVGRSCADNETEIANVVNKLMMFQTEPVIDEVETALMTGEDLGWNAWGWEYKEEVRTGSSNWGYTTAGIPGNITVGTLYEYPGQSWSAMGDCLPLLNQGPILVNHLGHANWDYVMQFGRSQISDNNFSNDGVNHNFFIGYSQGCICGDFAHFLVDCIIEEFTTIEHGAVAFIGNSRYGWGSYNNTNGASQHFDREFFDAIFGENITKIGWANQDSKEDNIWAVPGDDIIRWCYYDINLFGDPTMDIWTAEPGLFNPSYANAIQAGSNTFLVNSIAVEGALVTLSMNDDILGRGTADASGNAVISLEQPIQQLGEITLMITAHNVIPYEGSITGIPSSGPYIVCTDQIIVDGTSGNGNGQLDYGEEVALTVDIENIGVGDASGISLSLNTEDPLVTIIDETYSLGNLSAGGSTSADEAFAFEIVPEVEDGYEVDFTLTATDGDSTWLSQFNVVAHTPIVTHDNLLVEDPTGNNNNLLDPGETVNFNITIDNGGSSDAEDVTILLSCDDPAITITNATIDLTMIAAGSTITIDFNDVIADPEAVQGMDVEFNMTITTDRGYLTTEDFSITVGDILFRPCGPDAYGYFAYDSYDGAEAPAYEWIEIAPVTGGPGVDLNLTDENRTAVLPLPFSFQYYGVSYDQITVCTHGWISMDDPPIFFPLNICIPHLVPPNNMIAAFWDELDPTESGAVCYYDDPNNHRFIVEWFLVPHANNASQAESFQVFLYDPVFYETPTGDGEIVVSYQILSEALGGCAIGVENGDGSVGLQYLHNGNYDECAMPLEDGFAIRFTTVGEVTGVDPETENATPDRYALMQNYPNPFNPTTVLSYQLQVACFTELEVYDISGRLVTKLVNGWRDAGVHEVTFDGRDLASGIYFYRLTAGDFVGTGKMVLMK